MLVNNPDYDIGIRFKLGNQEIGYWSRAYVIPEKGELVFIDEKAYQILDLIHNPEKSEIIYMVMA